MIDFISTRNGTSEEDARCARLLTTVITTAIQDASIMPSQREQKEKRNISSDARAAIHWLFDKESVFPLYCQLIGMDAESVRRALIFTDNEPGSVSDKLFTGLQRRAIRARYRWLANDKDITFSAEDYDE